MLKKFAAFAAILIAGGFFYQNCAKVSFSSGVPAATGITSTCPGPTVICTVTHGSGTQSCSDTSSGPVYGQCVVDHCDPGYYLSGNMCLPTAFSLVVNGGGLTMDVSAFTANVGQTYNFKISGSTNEMSAGLNNSQSYLKKVSGQCSGNSIYQPFTLDLTQAGKTFQFGDNSFPYTSTIATSLGGCTWQICAVSALGSQACVSLTATENSVTTTTTQPTVTTVPVTSTTVKVTPTTMAPPPTSPPTTQPAACHFNGKTIPSGGTVTGYASSSVPYGQTCQSQTRTCTNGSLSGSYTASSCTVQPPAACNFNGQTIASGASVTGYQTATVGYGHTCAGETRTCNNGVLSGSFSNKTCSVNPTPDCPPATVSLNYACDDSNNGCGTWGHPIAYPVDESSKSKKEMVTDAVYHPQKNAKEFFMRVMYFGGQCPATMPGGATGDSKLVTLNKYQNGAGGQATVVCQNGQWKITSGDCAGNYGLCFYPKEGNNMVCTPSTKPNST